ncbi:DUF4097 family beta strand repeat protein [Paenibacillus sp. HJL G12]|uniref:DUF4097 family beta strand repeat protein n=1 Tax=Paenibacillus dendrobii TaxID=2691084 RepID=A0A7X3IM75_9BACL|nr:DUF4097 family beta strand repeat-containing protein [Paenibacillus dendrobii]MWV46548.1 DUF4097 family beta strand repeat protein [Paenibacillus dendrobii]
MNTPINNTPPTVKVGRWTTAIGLIGIGVLVLLQFNHLISFESLKYVWPVLLILLGLEVVLANVLHSDKRVRLGGGSVTILILLMLVSAAQVAIPNWSTLFNQGYATAVQGSAEVGSSIKRVEILVDHGKVNVIGSDDAKVSYDGKFRFRDVASQEAADSKIKEKWKVTPSGDTLVLSFEDSADSFFHIGFSPEDEYLNVDVPKALEVEVHTKNYSVKGEQLDAGFTAVTSNSSITLENIKGSVSAKTSNSSVHLADIGGAAQVKSTNGSLTLDRIAGAVTAKTSNSSIKGTSAIGGDWTCTSTNGSISLNVPKNTSAVIKAKTSNSSIKGDIPWSEESGDNKAGATLGDGTHKVELTTSNSSIKVNYGE